MVKVIRKINFSQPTNPLFNIFVMCQLKLFLLKGCLMTRFVPNQHPWPSAPQAEAEAFIQSGTQSDVCPAHHESTDSAGNLLDMVNQ